MTVKINQISFFNKFHCTGANCPANCCKGWRIPIDPETYERYQTERDKLGPAFRWAVKMDGEIPAMRSVFGRCPFWEKDRLCGIQKKHGAEYMPKICRQFPRRLNHLGFLCEETLYLACPEAVRLFLSYVKPEKHFSFVETEGEVTYTCNTTNDDKEFLDYLLMAREQLVGILRSGCRYNNMAFLRYAKAAQDACLSGEMCPEPSQFIRMTCEDETCGSDRVLEGVEMDGIDRSSGKDITDGIDRSSGKDKTDESDKVVGMGVMADAHFEIDCAMMNRIFDSGFFHPRLKGQLPFLYQLCQNYNRTLGNLSRENPGAANRRMKVLKEELNRKLPDAELLLDRFFEYYLYTDFLNIFEDYSFLRNLMYGMVKTDILRLLLALYAQDKERIAEEELTVIIALFERRAPHIKEAQINMSLEHK